MVNEFGEGKDFEENTLVYWEGFVAFVGVGVGVVVDVVGVVGIGMIVEVGVVGVVVGVDMVVE